MVLIRSAPFRKIIYMDRTKNLEKSMRLKRLGISFFIVSCLIVIWKLTVIESGVDRLQILREALNVYKEELHLSQQQLILLEQLESNRGTKDLPIIYAITPTYSRLVQKAELTRISQTLKLVPNIHWIVIEDSEEKTDLVRNLLLQSRLIVTHLNIKTPPFEKLKEKEPRWTKHRGVEQRNLALSWLRDNLQLKKDRGVVYFMDDDNTYCVNIFLEMSKIKKVGVWPVGLVGGLNVETPILDSVTGKVKSYKSGWRPNRAFAIDMAGFAINLDLILTKRDVNFSYKMEKGFQESEFLSYFITKEDLEPLADNCTKVYVWHTRTEKPTVAGLVDGFEV